MVLSSICTNVHVRVRVNTTFISESAFPSAHGLRFQDTNDTFQSVVIINSGEFQMPPGGWEKLHRCYFTVTHSSQGRCTCTWVQLGTIICEHVNNTRWQSIRRKTFVPFWQVLTHLYIFMTSGAQKVYTHIIHNHNVLSLSSKYSQGSFLVWIVLPRKGGGEADKSIQYQRYGMWLWHF